MKHVRPPPRAGLLPATEVMTLAALRENGNCKQGNLVQKNIIRNLTSLLLISQINEQNSDFLIIQYTYVVVPSAGKGCSKFPSDLWTTFIVICLCSPLFSHNLFKVILFWYLFIKLYLIYLIFL